MLPFTVYKISYLPILILAFCSWRIKGNKVSKACEFEEAFVSFAVHRLDWLESFPQTWTQSSCKPKGNLFIGFPKKRSSVAVWTDISNLVNRQRHQVAQQFYNYDWNLVKALLAAFHVQHDAKDHVNSLD